MIDHSNIAVVTTGTPYNSRQANALLKSIESVHPGLRTVVIAADEGSYEPSSEVRRVRDLAGENDTFAGIAHSEDAVAYCVPILLDELATDGITTLFIDSNCLVVNPLPAIEAILANHRAFGARSHIHTSPTSKTPVIDRIGPHARPGPVRMLGLRSDADEVRSTMREAMMDARQDAFMRPAHQILDWSMRYLMDTHLIAAAPPRTVVDLPGFAEYQPEGQSVDPILLDCASLWEVLARERQSAKSHSGGDAGEEMGYGGTPLGTLLMELRVHDLEPLTIPLGFIRAVNGDADDFEAEHPAERLLRDVRLAADPLGSRWGLDDAEEFRHWLFETNGAGLTRLAHLYWYTRRDLMEAIPEVRWDVSRFRRWNDHRALLEFGVDFFDLRAERTKPSEPSVPPPNAMGRPEWIKNAFAWRYNLLRTLVPGSGSDPEPKPRRSKEFSLPKRVQPKHTASRFGVDSGWITLMGLIRSSSGLGQAARASFLALEHLGRKFSVMDLTDQYLSRNTTDPGTDRHPYGAFGDLNLVHANAAEFAAPLGVFHHRLAGRYNVGMWFWEGATMPKEWIPAFDRVDELWLASEYLADVFGQYARVPVHVVGLAVDLPTPGEVDRQEFGLDPDDVVFLFVFDAQSVAERKNPDLALAAFEAAFGSNPVGVRFIVKTHNLHKMPQSEERLRKAEATNPGITVINEYWGRQKLLRLMQVADIYVSPHAAEGFGLTLLEAMALGTPVIATGYSGNMDFTTKENSWLLDYDLTRLDDQSGPYPAGTIWARPNLEALIEIMRSVVDDRFEAQRKGSIARFDALETASLERYAARLDEQLRRVL